uniref:STAS domain-containing protein n=2 Tax=Caenorhabditis japonica TaxID=281687 RepID=A0A8R1HPN8_CAEJA
MDPSPGPVRKIRHLSEAEEESADYMENFYNKSEVDNRPSFVQRGAMNQAQFDEKFDYNKPHLENEVKKQTRKFIRRFYEPFTSCHAFKLFILSLFPILQWLPNYNWKADLTADIIGGITVGVMQVPQGIAYALLAKQPPINGLYTSLFAPLIYMFFGTSRHSSLGTFAVISLMTGLSVERLAAPVDYEAMNMTEIEMAALPTATEVSCAITLTMGLILAVMFFLRLQFLTTYLSDQVIAGFTVGSSVHVLVSQLKTLLGIRGLPRHSGPFYLFIHLYDLALALPRANPVCIGISAVSIIILYIGKEFINPCIKKITKSNIPIPWELVIAILSTLFVFLTGVNTSNKVQVVNKIPIGAPEISVPKWDLIPKVLPDAVSITIVAVSIWLSISKMLAKKNSYELNAGQELFALSVTNVASSFIPSLPISCSLSRTLVAVGAGCRTQLSILPSSILVFLVVFLLGILLETLPMAALSAIICVALQGMFRKFSDLSLLWKVSKMDFAIWVVSCVATVLLDVSIGLIVSVGFALFTTILREQYPKWHLLASVNGTQDFRDAQRYGESVYFKGICIFRFDAPLLFSNVEVFKKSVEKAYIEWQTSHEYYVLREERGTFMKQKLEELDDGKDFQTCNTTFQTQRSNVLSRHFVIDCSGFTMIDFMGTSALKEVFSDMRKRGILVYFANAKAVVRETFDKCHFYEFVPKENFYPTMRDATCIARQRQLELGFKDTGYVPEHDRLSEVLSSHPM